MKKIGYLVALILVGFGVFTISYGNRTGMRTLTVKGMHCEDCVDEVRNALLEVEGVTRVTVSLEKGEAMVEYKMRRVTPEILQNTITGVEKKMQEEERSGCSPGSGVECCGSESSGTKKI